MDERTEIGTLGEFGLIDFLTKDIELLHSSTIVGVGDDAAVIDNFGKQTVISTDLLVEGIHFDLSYTPLKHLGYKAIVVNISDIYAMNAVPKQVLVGIGLSNRFSIEAISEFYGGIYLACKKFGVDMVGGDTSNSKKGFIISITIIGEVRPGKFVKRNTANKGDFICVSGDLGGAYLGLQLLEREKIIYVENPGVQPDLESESYIIKRQLMPEARRDVIEMLDSINVIPTSMIDISDGLSSEILHICKASQLGCLVYEDKVPIHNDTRRAAKRFNLDPLTCALNGGEDYELLFTINQSDYNAVFNSGLVSIIGNMTSREERVKMILISGDEVSLSAQGWNTFHK